MAVLAVAAGLLGSVAIGTVVLQSRGRSASPDTQLAAAERQADGTASRGARRGNDTATAMTEASGDAAFGSPADTPDATTTTTSSTTSTTTTTTTKPKLPVSVPTPAPAAKKASAPASAPSPKADTSGSAARKPAVSPAPSGGGGDTGIVGDDVWSRLARCESGGRNHSSGPYYGYFQFLPSTWRSLGGTGLPSDHTYLEQKDLAIKLQARSGWGQWPVCSKRAGAA